MSKKHMGSSIEDFLKKEGIFEEARSAGCEGSGSVAASGSHEETEDFQEQDGRAPEHKPHPDRPVA
jgi:hypothetical protein